MSDCSSASRINGFSLQSHLLASKRKKLHTPTGSEAPPNKEEECHWDIVYFDNSIEKVFSEILVLEKQGKEKIIAFVYIL